MAGMDGNRTHPGRLSSAPQTVLKTAAGGVLDCSSADVAPWVESFAVHICSHLSTVVCRLGCHLGCLNCHPTGPRGASGVSMTVYKNRPLICRLKNVPLLLALIRAS